MPRLKTPITYPIRLWLGKYLSWKRKMSGWKASSFAGRKLEKFFSHFPPEMGLEYFAIADIIEYQEWRLSQGVGAGSIDMEMRAAKSFWRWMIQDMELPLSNPFGKKPHVPKRRNRLTLESFRRLLSFIDYPEVRSFIIGLASGEKRACSIGHAYVGRLVHKASIAAGLPPMGWRELRRMLKSSLWRQAIQEQLGDNRPLVTDQFVSDFLTLLH